MKDFFSTTVIYLISLQMIFSSCSLNNAIIQRHYKRSPAGNGIHNYSLEELREKLKAFKVKVVGEEVNLDPECEKKKEQKDKKEMTELFKEDADKAMYDDFLHLGKNSCDHTSFNFIKDEEQPCWTKRKEGLVDSVAAAAILKEKELEDGDIDKLAPYRADDQELKALGAEAETYQNEVIGYLYDANIEDKETKLDLLELYLNSVVMPIRELITVKRSYLLEEYDGSSFINRFLPEFPTEIFPEEVEDQIYANEIIAQVQNSSGGGGGYSFSRKKDKFFRIVDHGDGNSNLEYDPHNIMIKDVESLLKAPTVNNYVRSLKWMTIYSMLSQIAFFQRSLGDKSEIEVPLSCQNHLNGNFPSKIAIPQDDSDQYNFINILIKRGFLLSDRDENDAFMTYFLHYTNTDPTKPGYSKIMPFEKYSYAQVGVKGEEREGHIPDMEDHTYFENIMKIKKDEIFSALSASASSSGYHGIESSKSMTIFNKIVYKPDPEKFRYSYKLSDGHKSYFDLDKMNISTYMAELMLRKGVTSVKDLITGDLKAKLEQRKVEIPFPSLHGNAVWRHWALRKLAVFAYENKDANLEEDIELKKAAEELCEPGEGGTDNPLCSGRTGAFSSRFQSLFEVLNFARHEEGYVPAERLKERGIDTIYVNLRSLWNYLREQDLIEGLKMSEKEFLLDQINAENPWARIRLSYLLAMDEMEKGKEDIINNNIKDKKESQCYIDNSEIVIDDIKEAAKVLKIDKVISLNHGNTILTLDEKKKVWQDYMDEVSESTSNIFLHKVSTEKQGFFMSLFEDPEHKTLYDEIDRVSYSTLISKESIDEMEEKMSDGLSNEMRESIEIILSSNLGKDSELFSKLYKLKHHTSYENPRKVIEEQVKVLNEYIENNSESVENRYSFLNDVKENFLKMDNNVKQVIYLEMMKNSAIERKDELMNQLDNFCKLDMDSHEEIQTLYHSSLKAQNKLNELTGSQAVSDEVLQKVQDKISEMSDEEFADIGLTIGMVFLLIGSLIVLSSCASPVGKLCLALGPTVGPLIPTAAITGLTLQGVLFKNELVRKTNADSYEKQVKAMEELGFAERDSSDNVSRSWAWTTIEGLGAIPFLGLVARSISVGAKIMSESVKLAAKKASEFGFRKTLSELSLISRGAAREGDLKLAERVINIKRGSGGLVEGSSRKVRKVKRKASLFSEKLRGKRAGKKASARGPLPKEGSYETGYVAAHSVEKINKQTAATVSKYFSGNAGKMADFMSSYSKKVVHANKVRDIIKEGRTPWLRIPFTEYFLSSKNIPYMSGVWNWVRNLRLKHLAEQGEKIKTFEKELRAVSLSKGSLEDFLLKGENIEHFTTIFRDIPMRMRELPYVFFLQGGPHMGGPLAGRRAGALGALADGILMRKIFNARSLLVQESMKAKARGIMNLGQSVGAYTISKSIKGFDKIVVDSMEKMSGGEAMKMAKKYKEMQDALIQAVKKKNATLLSTQGWYENVKRSLSPKKYRSREVAVTKSDEELKHILFNPKTEEDMAISDTLWGSMEPEELFSNEKVNDASHMAIQALSEYDKVDDFQKFLNALTVHLFSRDPGVVELM